MPVTARRSRIVLGLAALVVAASAPRIGADTVRPAVPANPDDRTIVHVLNRLGFGPAPGDVERVRKIGLQRYIDDQLQPERIANAALAPRLVQFDTLNRSTAELAREYFIPAQMERRRAQQQAANDPSMKPADGGAPPNRAAMRTPAQVEAMRAQREVFTDLAQQKLIRAAYSERQLEEVMVDFWFNHFNVFAGKGQTRLYLTEYERDTIRPRVLGRFRDLLGATAESPAMLFYLDNWQSAAAPGAPTSARRPDPAMFGRGRGRRPPTNAGAPQAQRPARGLNENYARELMELHTLGVDGGYTQKDVQEVARAFTGWTIAQPRQGGAFHFEPRMHDDGEKVVLGHRIKSGGGRKDGEQVLDILAEQPSTAQFISTKLVRRFVSDTPPKSLVDRAAARFRETHGDIREVVRTIVTSPEFFAADAYRAKTKTPFDFVVSAVRASGSDAFNALPLVNAMREMGMPPYQCQPPTGYADRGDAWVNTGALLARMNFALALASGRLPGIRPNGVTGDIPAVRGAIVDGVLADDLADSTRATVARATATPQLVALLLGSPEFQKR